MGTLLSIVALILSYVLLGTAFGPHFWVLLAMLVCIILAAFLRPSAPIFFGSLLLVGFSALASAPFEAPRKFLNVFKKQARGEGPEAEAAQQSLDLYTSLAELVWPLEGAIVLILIALAIITSKRGAEGAFSFVLDASDRIGNFTVKIGQWVSLLYIPMIIIIFYDVSQRKYLEVDPSFVDSFMFQTFTSTKLQEMQWHMHAVLFLLCFGFGYIKDAHVRIELVRDRLRPRTRVWIELLGCMIFMLPYCFLIYTYGFEFARKSFDIQEVSSALTGLPYRFIIKGFLPLGFAVLALAALSVWLKCVVYLFGPDYLKPRASYYAGTHHADMGEAIESDTTAKQAS